MLISYPLYNGLETLIKALTLINALGWTLNWLTPRLTHDW